MSISLFYSIMAKTMAAQKVSFKVNVQTKVYVTDFCENFVNFASYNITKYRTKNALVSFNF